jgi:hypothetical protein
MASEALALRVTEDLTETSAPLEGEVMVTVGAVESPEEMPPVGDGDGAGDGAGDGDGVGLPQEQAVPMGCQPEAVHFQLMKSAPQTT